MESVGQKVRSRESSRWSLCNGVLTVHRDMFKDAAISGQTAATSGSSKILVPETLYRIAVKRGKHESPMLGFC
jgi:hypothetical protein